MLNFDLTAPLADAAVATAIGHELQRQADQIELIASENVVSADVLRAQGSVLTNKYAEGYPGRRYYGGCEHVDEVETLAIERAKTLFKAGFANVQPHSGAQANQSVFLALLKPGERILGMSLAHGGHLTHGSPVTMSGKWFEAVSYEVRQSDQLIDYDALRTKALEAKPKLIVAGASGDRLRRLPAHRRRGRRRADGRHGPLRRPDRGWALPGSPAACPRGHDDHAQDAARPARRHDSHQRRGPGERFNSAVFPGNQGGPLMHVIAAKAVAFGEALRPEFKTYAADVIDNARALAQTLVEGGLAIVSGGTDCHMVLVDLRPKGVKGRDAERALERAGLTCNKNAIPFDPEKPAVTSGVRLGSSAGTTRGFGRGEFRRIGELMLKVVDAMATSGPEGDAAVEGAVLDEVRGLCRRFPIYRG